PTLAFRPFPLSGLVPLLSPGHFQSTLDSFCFDLFFEPIWPIRIVSLLSPHIQS
ncbi:putative Jerky protein like protein, partial [Fusarium oxysporum f. sp. albedinis]